VRAVASLAGVNERTVYRYFANERELHDEVMHRLEQQSGIDLNEFRLGDVVDATARILGAVSAHPLERRAPLDPTLAETGERTREALRRAVAGEADRWSPSEQAVGAAMLDVLWSVASYERLTVDWQLDQEQIVDGVTWVVDLIKRAIEDGHRPGASTEA